MPPDLSKGMAIKQETLATPHSFSLKCDPCQCLFCISDKHLFYQQRIFCWSWPVKMMDYAEDKHFHLFAPDAKIPYSHPMCKERHITLNNILHFKSHAYMVYKIKHWVLKTMQSFCLCYKRSIFMLGSLVGLGEESGKEGGLILVGM